MTKARHSARRVPRGEARRVRDEVEVEVMLGTEIGLVSCGKSSGHVTVSRVRHRRGVSFSQFLRFLGPGD